MNRSMTTLGEGWKPKAETIGQISSMGVAAKQDQDFVIDSMKAWAREHNVSCADWDFKLLDFARKLQVNNALPSQAYQAQQTGVDLAGSLGIKRVSDIVAILAMGFFAATFFMVHGESRAQNSSVHGDGRDEPSMLESSVMPRIRLGAKMERFHAHPSPGFRKEMLSGVGDEEEKSSNIGSASSTALRDLPVARWPERERGMLKDALRDYSSIHSIFAKQDSNGYEMAVESMLRTPRFAPIAALYQRMSALHGDIDRETLVLFGGPFNPYERLALNIHAMIHLEGFAHDSFFLRGKRLRPYSMSADLGMYSSWGRTNNDQVTPSVRQQNRGKIFEDYARLNGRDQMGHVLEEILAYAQTVDLLCVLAPEAKADQLGSLSEFMVYLDEFIQSMRNVNPQDYSWFTRQRGAVSTFAEITRAARETIGLCEGKPADASRWPSIAEIEGLASK